MLLEEETEGCIDICLANDEFPMGATYKFGDVYVTMVAGFHRPPTTWGNLSTSEERNAGSIVVRLVYGTRSVLFCGDAVGRHTGDPVNACIAIEEFMVDNADVIPIDSDVLIAPHHGADNASSTAFIQAVSPQYVIFSAGHMHEHPRAATAQRYLNNGMALANMFRTDTGDDESSPGQPDREWNHDRVPGHNDPAGDDDVDITIQQNGTVTVRYRPTP